VKALPPDSEISVSGGIGQNIAGVDCMLGGGAGLWGAVLMFVWFEEEVPAGAGIVVPERRGLRTGGG
jgi:hypothetical protein